MKFVVSVGGFFVHAKFKMHKEGFALWFWHMDCIFVFRYASDGSEQYVKSWGNIAAVRLNEKKWEEVLKAADIVLQYQPDDFKALSNTNWNVWKS